MNSEIWSTHTLLFCVPHSSLWWISCSLGKALQERGIFWFDLVIILFFWRCYEFNFCMNLPFKEHICTHEAYLVTTDTLYGFKFRDPFSFSSPSDVSSYIIYVGRHQINNYNPHESSHRVRQVIVPSGYVEPHSGQDVALVELSTPITWSDYVSPICLPSSGTLFPSGMQCYVTGWGNIRDDGRCSPYLF